MPSPLNLKGAAPSKDEERTHPLYNAQSVDCIRAKATHFFTLIYWATAVAGW